MRPIRVMGSIVQATVSRMVCPRLLSESPEPGQQRIGLTLGYATYEYVQKDPAQIERGQVFPTALCSGHLL